MRRSLAFRSPYVAIWVSDDEGRVVRTLLLIGKIKEWQEFNHIWWRLNRGLTEQLLNGRSMSTRGSGIYKVFWDGVDDDGQRVKTGKYTLHVETSRERGEHTHRTLDIDVSTLRPFEAEIPMNPDTGGLSLEFKKF
jgi:thiamine biosynthesis lipoprotein